MLPCASGAPIMASFERQVMPTPPAKVPRDLLKQMLNGWKTVDELNTLLQAHPELQPYNRIAISVVFSLGTFMGIVMRDLLDADMKRFDIARDPNMNKNILLPGKPKYVFAEYPDLPQELLNNILARAEPGEETMLTLLVIMIGSKDPDFLTEESYELLCAMGDVYPPRHMAQCRDTLKFCLENGLDKNFILQLIELGQQEQAGGADQAPHT